jgi:hypothetical protein
MTLVQIGPANLIRLEPTMPKKQPKLEAQTEPPDATKITETTRGRAEAASYACRH